MCGKKVGCGSNGLRRNQRKRWSKRERVETISAPPVNRRLGGEVMKNRRLFLLAGVVALLAEVTGPPAGPQAPPSGPALQDLLRSRPGGAAAMKDAKDCQTRGGKHVVEQVDPNTIMVTMGGAVVVGSDL